MCWSKCFPAGPAFAGMTVYKDLLEAKRILPQHLQQIMPDEVACNDLLMSFCRGLIAPDPNKRFASAEAADMVKGGAASFLRQLIVGGLAANTRMRFAFGWRSWSDSSNRWAMRDHPAIQR